MPIFVTYFQSKNKLHYFKAYRDEKGRFRGLLEVDVPPIDWETYIKPAKKGEFEQYSRDRHIKKVPQKLISSEQIKTNLLEKRYTQPLEITGKLHLKLEFFKISSVGRVSARKEAAALSSRRKITAKTYKKSFNEAYRKCLAQCDFSPDGYNVLEEEYVYWYQKNEKNEWQNIARKHQNISAYTDWF
jgi:hypothetical protein